MFKLVHNKFLKFFEIIKKISRYIVLGISIGLIGILAIPTGILVIVIYVIWHGTNKIDSVIFQEHEE